MTEMRIMTVRRPWASLIVHGGKDVENRPRNIAGKHRGLVAIHAGLARVPGVLSPSELAALLRGKPEPMGAIVGVVELVGVHDSGADGCGTREGFGTPIPLCSEWAQPWSVHLVLANARPLLEPVPFTGALGLRRLDGATIAQIQAGLR